jgi:ABC-type glycerol-3-phosphate transport system substrate-binding protein
VIFAPPVSTKPMKIRIRVYSLSSDDDHGTNTLLFSNEEKAVAALLDKLEISTTVQTEFGEYTRDRLKRFYFFPDELPKTYNDFFELLNEIKDPADSYNIDKHLVEVEGSNIPFIEQIADMTQDGEMLEDENGAKYEFVLENDDAVSTLHALIDEARELVGRKDEDSQDGSPSL